MGRERACGGCGHAKSKHTIMSGPNSIGQWHFGMCSVGGKEIFPYFIGGCGCTYRRPTIWQRIRRWFSR
ncbi:hypothetical protein AS850_02785 [Frondihabitans sp. 762G35]|nr:hypothetical protein AS850_02785 [Frondihabitans sp. 762G35]